LASLHRSPQTRRHRPAGAGRHGLATHIAQAYPKSNKGWGVFVEPLKNDFLASERKQTLWLLLGAVAFILLIACVNVAGVTARRVGHAC
jgi:putative ABC transport system permease protein